MIVRVHHMRGKLCTCVLLHTTTNGSPLQLLQCSVTANTTASLIVTLDSLLPPPPLTTAHTGTSRSLLVRGSAIAT